MFPIFFFDFVGMLEIAVNLLSAIMDISNVAFASGSSQQGNARLASAASNWVVARYFVLFPCLYIDYGKTQAAYHLKFPEIQS